VIITCVNMRGSKEEVSSSVSVARYWNGLKKTLKNCSCRLDSSGEYLSEPRAARPLMVQNYNPAASFC